VVWGSVVGLVAEILLGAGLIIALVERKEMTMSLRTSLRAAGGARLGRRRAIILGAALWAGLFGLEMAVLPPWGGHERPASSAPAARIVACHGAAERHARVALSTGTALLCTVGRASGPVPYEHGTRAHNAGRER
jgi:hypothetical protein